jgi:hypothetical protein
MADYVMSVEKMTASVMPVDEISEDKITAYMMSI